MLNLNVKLSEVQLLLLSATFQTLPLCYLRSQRYFLRAYARKNYVTEEIHPKGAIEGVRINMVPLLSGCP